MSFPHVPGYQLESRLGQGAFGVVYEAIWNGDFACALKVLEEGALHREYLADVLERLSDLAPHDGLLPVYAVDFDERMPHLSMALLPPGSVTFDDLAGQLTRDEAWKLLGQLAESLAWLHGNGLVHAGLTGGNVFVVTDEKGEPKTLLTDVGQAWLGDGPMERLHDQAPYVPPERWRDPGKVLQDGHAETWDVYAFGVLAWRLLNGRWPRANKLFDRVLSGKGEKLAIDPPAFAEWLAKERPPAWKDEPRDAAGHKARQMVLQCVALDPAERPQSMVEVAAALRELANDRKVSESPPALDAGQDSLNGRSALATEIAFPLPAVMPALAPSAKLVVNEPALSDRAIELAARPLKVTAAVKPDFSGLFAKPTGESAGFPVIREGSFPAGDIVAKTSDPAYDMAVVPPDGPVPPANPIAHSGTGRAGLRFAVAASLAVGIGSTFYALQLHEQAGRGHHALVKAEAESFSARAQAAAAAEKLAALETERAGSHVTRLSESRDEWARLVSAVLEARPVEPAALTAWKATAAPAADRLKAALSAAALEPALISTGMEPRWKLAELYEGLAQPEESLPLLEHLARDLEATAATGVDGTRGLLRARVASRRGAILLESRRTMDAAPLLQEASAAYESWLSTHSDRHDIAREYAVNSLLEGKALNERAHPAPARAALARVAGLLGKPEDGGFLPEDHFTLTDSLMELAALDSAGGELASAIEQHLQAVRLLVSYDQDNRQSVPCRRRLADGYFGLGRLLTKNGTPRDASVAFSEAVKLLTELSKESPAEPSYRLQLALTYNEVAQLIRTSRPNPAGAKEALEYQNGSVTILRNLNEANTLDNILRRHLAAALVQNAELQELAGNSRNGLDNHSEALAILAELLAEATLPDSDRRECRRLSARAWTAMGGMQEKAGQKEDAIASLNKALEAWSGFAGDDPAADKIVASTRERLRKLKPES